MIVVKGPEYCYALRIVQLGGTELMAQPIAPAPAVGKDSWSVRDPGEGTSGL